MRRARPERLGAEEALIVYHRDRAQCRRALSRPTRRSRKASIKWLTSIKEIVGPSLTVERMTLDENGRPQPTGEIETLEADAVVLALGQQTDGGLLRQMPGVDSRRTAR